MVQELKKYFEEDKVFFGIKECLKKAKELERVKLTSDSREKIKKLLKLNKLDFEIMDLSKDEVSNRIGINFKCEAFGLKK